MRVKTLFFAASFRKKRLSLEQQSFDNYHHHRHHLNQSHPEILVFLPRFFV